MILLTALACGVLGYEIVYSSLSLFIQRIFWLDNKNLDVYSTTDVYQKHLGWLVYPLIPIIAIVIVLTNLRKVIASLLECPFCTSFWVGIIVSFFVLSYPITSTVLVGLLSMAGCAVYNRLRS